MQEQDTRSDQAPEALTLTLTLLRARGHEALGRSRAGQQWQGHLPQDLQLETGSKVKLHFETIGAKQVQITATPARTWRRSTSTRREQMIVNPHDNLATYTATVLNGNAKSDPAGPVTVHFHAPDMLVSPLAAVSGQSAVSPAHRRCQRGSGRDREAPVGCSQRAPAQLDRHGGKQRAPGRDFAGRSSGRRSRARSCVARAACFQSTTDDRPAIAYPLDPSGSGSGAILVDPRRAAPPDIFLTVVPVDVPLLPRSKRRRPPMSRTSTCSSNSPTGAISRGTRAACWRSPIRSP